MLRGNKLLVVALFSVAGIAGGACNCGARLALSGTTKITISSPTTGAQFLPTDTITFTATADNAAGLNSFALEVGSVTLNSCPGSGAATTEINCSGMFTASDMAYAGQVAANQLVLTAQAVSAAGISASASVTVYIGTIPPDAGPAIWSLQFVQPMPSSGFPPSASVSAPSTLQMGIVGMPSTPITSIVVTDEHNNQIANFTSTPYSTTVTWLTEPGVGNHTLTGLATDQAGEMETANLVLTVNSPNCTSDASCAAGSRCCLDDGMCHPIVAENADCDCQHPCPLDEGCFPGTCGKLPQQCRPGCFPGNENQVPGNCATINGVQAYCSPLPPSQVTTQNQGGACAPGDGCDVVTQNCPNGPLDPASDAGPPANPIVPYTCEPASVNATVCFPAGTHPPQTNNPSNSCEGESDTCGSDTAGCTKGYLCTGIEGDPSAGLACSQQCSDPQNVGVFGSPTQSPDCPQGQFCTQLFGDGQQLLPTGICVSINED